MENVIVSSDRCVCTAYIYKIMASALTITSHKLLLWRHNLCALKQPKNQFER